MTPTFKEKVKYLTGRFENRLPIFEDDLEEIDGYADDEIFVIRRSIEQNHECLDNLQTRENKKRLLCSYGDCIHEMITRIELVLKNHEEKRYKSSIEQKEEWIKEDVFLSDETNIELYRFLRGCIQEILNVFIDYFPELSSKDSIVELIKKYLPKDHWFMKKINTSNDIVSNNSPSNSNDGNLNSKDTLTKNDKTQNLETCSLIDLMTDKIEKGKRVEFINNLLATYGLSKGSELAYMLLALKRKGIIIETTRADYYAALETSGFKDTTTENNKNYIMQLVDLSGKVLGSERTPKEKAEGNITKHVNKIEKIMTQMGIDV